MKRFLSTFLILLVTGLAAAQGVQFSPQSIVINPLPSFEVKVWLDRDPSGEGVPGYRIGDPIRIGVQVSEASYVYLFNVRSTGQVLQILPNRFDAQGQNNFLRAGESRTFPPAGARYIFTVDGPAGIDKVIAVASRRPLDTSELASFERDPDFATSDIGENGFAGTFSIIVEPLPQADWVTDTVRFRVEGHVTVPAPAPRSATLEVRSFPAGARVFVDGLAMGQTPLRLGTSSGHHELRLELPGYQSYRTSLDLAGGETRMLDVDLQRVVATPAPVAVGFFDYPRLLAYPGTRITRLEQDHRRLRADFEVGADLERVYRHLDGQLQSAGWQRLELELRPNKAGARYRQAGQAFRLDLQRRGGSGGYRLEIAFVHGDG